MELIVGLIFVAVGTVFVILSLWDLFDAFACRSWKTADGVIVVSDLERSADSDGVSYRAEISYRYRVNGEELVASRARFGDRMNTSWSKPAVRLVTKYPVGKEVTVLYNPENPNEAVLEPGLTLYIAAGLAIGSIFVVIGALAMRAGV